jgi:diphosphomevalonate decarboxylase
MPAYASSVPNIALIKYWGNRNNDLRLPAADSVSMTLNTPHVEITVDHSDKIALRSFEFDGREREMTMKHLVRFQKHLELTKQYFMHIGLMDAIPESLSYIVHSGIPPAIGLASSAAVFSCVAEAIAGLIKQRHRELTREEVSIIARLGSGSAARSVYGGYVALHAGSGNDIGSSVAEQVAPAEHWTLHDIVVVPTIQEKEYGSTEGHGFAHTSPLFKKRVEDIMDRRQKDCIDAIRRRDFELLQKVAEEDSLNMHEVMKSSDPPLHYLSKDTYKIIDEIEVYRRMKNLAVLYTMDAGPTVHLICTEEAKDEVLHYAHSKEEFTVFVARTGNGSFQMDKPKH